MRSREEELTKQQETLKQRERDLYERELDLIEREIMVFFQQTPTPKKRKGHFKRSRLKLTKKDAQKPNISFPKGLIFIVQFLDINIFLNGLNFQRSQFLFEIEVNFF